MSLLKRLSRWISRRMQESLAMLESVWQMLAEWVNPALREPEYVRIPVEEHPPRQRPRRH